MQKSCNAAHIKQIYGYDKPANDMIRRIKKQAILICRSIVATRAACFLLLTVMLFQADYIYGASIMIAWNANQESDLDGYKVYYGATAGNYGSPIDVGKITAYEITGLNSGTRYYIALTAYDTSDNESAKSVEISGVADAASTTSITSTRPSSSSTAASSVPATTSSTAPVTTTSITATTTQVSSTSTIAVQSSTTSTAVLPITTSAPVTTSTPVSSTSTVEPETTTTTSVEGEPSSCDEPEKLQPFSVSSSDDPRPLFSTGNLVDGDPQTAWLTIFTWFKKDASLTLDMGSEKTITSLSLYASRLFGIDFLPANLELQISNDNTAWQTITAGSVSSSIEPPYADSWKLGGHTCRYIKLCISGRKTIFFFQLAQIAELEIYGCNQTDHIPFASQNSASTESNQPFSTPEKNLRSSGHEAALPPGIPGRPAVRFQ